MNEELKENIMIGIIMIFGILMFLIIGYFMLFGWQQYV